MVMVSEDMHQRTGEQEQIGHSGENVTCMRGQQVDANRRGQKAYRQTKPGLEEVAKRVHDDAQRSRFPEAATYRRGIGLLLS